MKNLDLFKVFHFIWIHYSFGPISFLPIAVGLKKGRAGNRDLSRNSKFWLLILSSSTITLFTNLHFFGNFC